MSERVEFDNNPCIQRIEEKCTRCGICKKTCEKNNNIGDECIKCGQCILTCPMGALVPKFDYQKVLNYLKDTNYTVIISIAPSARVSLVNELKLDPSNATKELVGVLRKVGFDYVYDVAVGADLTTIEESLEFIERIKENNFPLITSCCPSWKKYAINHNLDKYISSTKSPIKMQGYIVKKYISKYVDYTNKVINVMLMPCVSKKEEILDSEDIDYVITTRELIYLINEANVDLENVIPSEFDKLAGYASSSGIIFGTSGGVLEAVLRSAYYFINNKKMPDEMLNLNLDNDLLFKENTYDMGKLKINVAKVSTIAELQKVDINKYHLIEVMACPGGCINGGGQPLNANNENNEKRKQKSKLLIDIDLKSNFRNSYLSKEIKDIYTYDIGIPGGKKSKQKLHD